MSRLNAPPKVVAPTDVNHGELTDIAAISAATGVDQLAALLHDLSARLHMQPLAACRVSVLCTLYELPEKTFHQIELLGLGPRLFVIGRLKYCLVADWVRWLEHLAEIGGTRLTGKRKQAEQVAAYAQDVDLHTRVTRAARPARKQAV